MTDTASKKNVKDTGLRGDYAGAAPDYSVHQHWERYSEAEHDLYRRLYARQSRLVREYACPEYLHALHKLDAGGGVPRFDDVSRRLRGTTGWELVPVPGLLPDHAFFKHLANRRFPVTVWLRRPDEFDYIVEPDVFHDFFGHVPLLLDRVFADYLQAYGEGGLRAETLGAIGYLARLYWFTVEFGLVMTRAGLRVYGAGLLSSPQELPYSVDDPTPQRLPFDLMRVMRTSYVIDRMQERYFVIDSFAQLFEATAADFAPLYAELADAA
jgi:phenylalanine-4-hydroxylase